MNSVARWHRLHLRIRRRYATKTEPVRIGAITLSFTRIADPDVVLNEVAAEADLREKVTGKRESDPQHLPYWAELWDSAAGVGQFLGRNGLLPGRATPPTGRFDVLDLGCGMGLAGTVAATLGATVVFADLEAPALLFARLNSLPCRRRVHTRRLNWRLENLGQVFDLIIGSDILYERKEWDFLEPFWRTHLATGGSVLLGEPGRQTGDLFLPWIAARGWKIEQFAEKVPTRATPVRLFHIRPDGSGA
jgi:predicted nicotinamide N-methyase